MSRNERSRQNRPGHVLLNFFILFCAAYAVGVLFLHYTVSHWTTEEARSVQIGSAIQDSINARFK